MLPSRAEAEQFVHAAYQLAFGREADPEGLRTYSQALFEGRETPTTVLKILRQSEEHQQAITSRGHRSLQQEDINTFLSVAYQAILQRPVDHPAADSARSAIQANQLSHADTLKSLLNSEEYQSITNSPYEQIYKQHVPQQSLLKGETILTSFKTTEEHWLNTINTITQGGDDYIKTHAIRFAELLHTISELNRENELSTILDCGHKHSGLLISSCFGEACRLYNINIEDASEAGSYLAGHFHTDLERDDLDNVDLGKTFDLVVFAEVLEHLRINPVKVMRFLGKHLSPHGKIVLTTPNFYNHNNLNSFRLRQSMQPDVPYNLEYHQLHFHHVHEYCAHEVLVAGEAANLKLEAFWFSDCWDRNVQATIPIEARSNMVFIFGHP